MTRAEYRKAFVACKSTTERDKMNRKYYSQYVTKTVRKQLLALVDRKMILSNNPIPTDVLRITSFIMFRDNPELGSLLRLQGDEPREDVGMAIIVEAAMQIIDEKKNQVNDAKTSGLCGHPGCDKKYYAKGFCINHYQIDLKRRKLAAKEK